MVLSQYVDVIWNSKNKNHYVNLGYKFTKMGDVFSSKVCDLTKGSSATIRIRCDYCGKEFEIQWVAYQGRKRKNIIQKDCCKECLNVKAKESIVKKYGGYTNCYNAVNDKRIATNIDRYGSANPFGSDIIKKRIEETNLRKYGVKCSQQNKEIRAKTEQTCMERYGVQNYVELFKGKFIKEQSPVWKGGVKYSRVERATYEYNTWRKRIFERDEYTCVKCGARSGSGSRIELNAHHILNWRDNEDCRYDIDNGVTLCESCHQEFHSIYGKRNNSLQQIKEFLEIDEKVC